MYYVFYWSTSKIKFDWWLYDYWREAEWKTEEMTAVYTGKEGGALYQDISPHLFGLFIVLLKKPDRYLRKRHYESDLKRHWWNRTPLCSFLSCLPIFEAVTTGRTLLWLRNLRKVLWKLLARFVFQCTPNSCSWNMLCTPLLDIDFSASPGLTSQEIWRQRLWIHSKRSLRTEVAREILGIWMFFLIYYLIC